MPLLEIRNLTKIFPHAESPFGGKAGGGSGREVRAVDDVSLDIHSGETLGLVGESGSGKSTLGRLILRLIEPTSGTIRHEGRDLLAASGSEMRRLRRHLQIIFQDPFASLDPRFRVEQIIAEPLIVHGDSCGDSRPRLSGRAKLDGGDPHLEGPGAPLLSRSLRQGGTKKDDIRARVVELLRAVGLDESALRRYPHEFSGGQRQRIGIARALALRPKFIVCDEPVSALDVSVGAQIVNLLAQLQRDFGLTYLFIAHSMPVVRYLSTRIAVMYRGKIVEVGDTAQITERPQHAYTRSLLEATPELV
ncbi:Oligopeptide transport ATP-binding protein OppF [Candidatus Sulfotelmatobacter kueseliae]|uniref:Oligopeptide transport ATP-binding protein OppF n=1 Tax=Candidatus Sulfotelmatobacter kueseliae TaxID=2042962 RepID=A0A2U3LAI4_9BACT|nr:Oligopeptide transport ATP-binding protein OppF [Candidatus Sulfotelmatobacter kueseliae]